MALGSSAPEIMLNVLEIVLREFFSGDLGPSTIVGSAAFNLMVIIAVCVYVIPDGQSRQIESLEPFLVTAFFSIAAYLWMLVVISWTTPDVITILEAVITLCLFPTLILVAYAADVGCFSCGKQEDEDDDHVEFIKEKVIEAGFDLTTDETKKLKRLKTAELAGAKSRMQNKIDANPIAHHKLPKQELSIGFVSAKYLFSSECSEMVLTVEKRGENADLVKNARVVFEYKTTDGPNMRADDYDYIPQSSEFGEIPSGERCGQIVISRKPQKVSDVMNGGDPSKKAPAQAGAGRNVSRFFSC
jgi:Ca2+/Na+ antiporter